MDPFCYMFHVCLYYSVFKVVCSLQPCDHLLGKDIPRDSIVCDVPCVFVTFPYCFWVEVWYLSALIPDLCLLFYLQKHSLCHYGIRFLWGELEDAPHFLYVE